MTKIQKAFNFTCPVCHSIYKLLELHQSKSDNCPFACLSHWQSLLHSHYQEQIILYLAQEEAKKD